MSNSPRFVTRGNRNADLTKIRGDLAKINPVIQATMRNAVPENGRSPVGNELNKPPAINPHKLTKLSNIISANINAAVDLRVITPYIDKAELIWNTILFNPNGKQDEILTYDTRSSKVKSTKLHAELMQPWKQYFTNDYKIEEDLRSMASDIMWNTGSYVLLNLSRSGLDYLINGSEKMDRGGNEAHQLKLKSTIEKEFVKVDDKFVARNLGRYVRDPGSKDVSAVNGLEAIMGGTPQYSGNEFNIFNGNEDWKDPITGKPAVNITITDNPAILFLQKINANQRMQDASTVMGAESIDLLITNNLQSEKKKNPPKDPKATTLNLTENEVAELGRSLFPDRNTSGQSIQFIKTDDSLKVQTYGRGLTFHVPSEAVIPIHRRGNRKQQGDVIILMGDDGEFLRTATDAEFYQAKKQPNTNGSNQAGSVNSLITNLRQVQDGKPCDFDMTEFGKMSSASIIKQFMSSVLSGKGDNISITLDEEINKIFLSRIFKGQGIRCLYVPGECVTYMAFKYSSLGIGQSLTQAAKLHIARLAAYDVADALANISAAQPHSQLNINIAKEDPDPANTIAIARSTFFESNPRVHDVLSVAQLSIPQVVDALRESSLTVKINPGENVHMPAPEIDLQRFDNSHYKTVDPASRDEVNNKISNYFNLPRSWLDVINDSNNFQIEALTEHQMVMNQATAYQEQLTGFVMDFQRKHVAVNAPLLNDLVKVIIGNKGLWKTDSGEEIPGTESERIKIILNDFITNLFCTLPTPASTDNINKLKDKLEAIDALVTAWESMSGYAQMIPGIATALGLEQSAFSADEIKAAVTATFKMAAFKKFNLPIPFDDIVGEGKGGGLASLVNSIVYHRANVGEFLGKYVTEVAKEDRKLIKTHYKAIGKALDELAAATPNGEPEVTDDNLDGSTNVPESTDTPDDDLNDNNLENEDNLEPEAEEDADMPTEGDGGADGLDPKKNDPKEDPFS